MMTVSPSASPEPSQTACSASERFAFSASSAESTATQPTANENITREYLIVHLRLDAKQHSCRRRARMAPGAAAFAVQSRHGATRAHVAVESFVLGARR